MAPSITDHWATHDAYQGDSMGSLRQEDRAPPRRSIGPGPYVIQRGSSIRKDLQTVHRLFVLHPCPAGPLVKQFGRQLLLCLYRMHFRIASRVTKPQRGTKRTSADAHVAGGGSARPPEGPASRASPLPLTLVSLRHEEAAACRDPCGFFERQP